jgi:hypothetical protein
MYIRGRERGTPILRSVYAAGRIGMERAGPLKEVTMVRAERAEAVSAGGGHSFVVSNPDRHGAVRATTPVTEIRPALRPIIAGAVVGA